MIWIPKAFDWNLDKKSHRIYYKLLLVAVIYIPIYNVMQDTQKIIAVLIIVLYLND